MSSVPVVDLFSGPGGLAEGFAALRDSQGQPCFSIALSVEKDEAAYRTLRLRGFLRKFSSGFPPEYYDFLNGLEAREPDWETLYPEEWKKASDETLCLTLGATDAAPVIKRRVELVRELYGDKTVLLGGPPCQSYSVIGRSRNSGNARYNADEDERQSLYQEYAAVLGQLRPTVAVMENVGGILSARHKGRLVFPDVMESLQNAGGLDQYRLYALASPYGSRTWAEGLNPKDFLVRAEEYGVPQTRHRVFVICIRSDVANVVPKETLPRLIPDEATVSLRDVIGLMPMLRSRLSWDDDANFWQDVVKNACKEIRTCLPEMEQPFHEEFSQILDNVSISTQGDAPPFREAKGETSLANSCPAELREWIVDDNITILPNNETRSHMHEDIARYLYAATFASVFDRSPKAIDFPRPLAPKHSNWNTGAFKDRFRVQLDERPSSTITSHLSKDGHYFIHPDPSQCRSLTVREAARLQTFPDNYFFHGSRSQQYIQVGNAVPPYLARQIAEQVQEVLEHYDSTDKGVMRTSKIVQLHAKSADTPFTSAKTVDAP